MPRQLPGDERNVHRRMDNTEFYASYLNNDNLESDADQRHEAH